jgi:hypothetical protein
MHAEPRLLESDERERFERDGYLMLPGVLDGDVVGGPVGEKLAGDVVVVDHPRRSSAP